MSAVQTSQPPTGSGSNPAPVSTQSEHGDFIGAYPDGIEHHYWSSARNRMIHRLIVQHGHADSPVLEIGCARGVVAQYLRNEGIDCWGVDLEPSAPMNESIAPYIQSGVDVFDLDADWLGRFKTVLLLDVLEHIEDPAEFLKLVMERIPSAHRVIITMPACMSLWSNYDEHYGHYLRYDRSSMHALADDSGSSIRSWGYAFRPLGLAGWLTARLRMNRSTTIQAPSNATRPLHGVIASVMSMGFELLPPTIPGSSIYAVLQRTDLAQKDPR